MRKCVRELEREVNDVSEGKERRKMVVRERVKAREEGRKEEKEAEGEG